MMNQNIEKTFEERIAALNKANEEKGMTYSARSQGEKRTYTVSEIQDILGICRTSCYNLLKTGQFRVIRIGAHIRIPCKSFDEWLDGASEEVIIGEDYE